MAQNKNVVEEDANWTIRIRTEQKRSKDFANEWGFLSATEHRALGRSVSPVKYHGVNSSWTVKQIRVPDKVSGGSLPVVSSERLLEKPLRPGTAMESVVMSNMLNKAYLQKANPFFVPSSHAYGSRLPLEQFGVAQHGIRATRTKLPSR